MSDNHADVNGENNPAFGKRWYTDGKTNIFTDITEAIPEGYYPGVAYQKRSEWSEDTRQTRKSLSAAKNTCVWQHKETGDIYKGTAVDLATRLDVNIDFRSVARGVRKSAKGWICLEKTLTSPPK